MTTTRGLLAVLLLTSPWLGCVATRTATSRELPKERATECRSLCEQLDMRLSAIVIIRDSAGCVCEPKPAEGSNPTAPGATAAAGGALIKIAEEEEQQAQAHGSSGHRTGGSNSHGAGPGPHH